MTWANPKRIYTTKSTLGFKRNPKESAWATNIRCTLLSQLSLGIFHELLVEWVSSQMCKSKTSRILLYVCVCVCVCSIPKSKLKSKSSHSLIHMGFIWLVKWSRVRGLWKKGLERFKECLRVILGKNIESLACTFIYFNFFGLGSIPFVLFINLYCTFVPFCKIWRSFVFLFFFFTCPWWIFFLLFFS